MNPIHEPPRSQSADEAGRDRDRELSRERAREFVRQNPLSDEQRTRLNEMLVTFRRANREEQ